MPVLSFPFFLSFLPSFLPPFLSFFLSVSLSLPFSTFFSPLAYVKFLRSFWSCLEPFRVIEDVLENFGAVLQMVSEMSTNHVSVYGLENNGLNLSKHEQQLNNVSKNEANGK